MKIKSQVCSLEPAKELTAQDVLKALEKARIVSEYDDYFQKNLYAIDADILLDELKLNETSEHRNAADRTYPLLLNAPAHDSEEFLMYLRENNRVVYSDGFWLVIENCKYHRTDRLWLTAFAVTTDYQYIPTAFLKEFGHLEWKKKSSKSQTVKRFHIHMYEAE